MKLSDGFGVRFAGGLFGSETTQLCVNILAKRLEDRTGFSMFYGGGCRGPKTRRKASPVLLEVPGISEPSDASLHATFGLLFAEDARIDRLTHIRGRCDLSSALSAAT